MSDEPSDTRRQATPEAGTWLDWSEPAATPLATHTDDRYATRGHLGAGGSGEVVVALDARLGREVAFKASLATAPDADGRFGREAWITAQLEHPNIVPLYDAGLRPDGSPYYTMRLVHGRSLGAALQACAGLEERLGLLDHFADVCHALAYAHSRGVIHRDLKPDNIMVGTYGETQVVDWGLAVVRGEPEPGRGPVTSFPEGGLTAVGSIVGTPAYMSPEQARGARCDLRTDVFGLGAILFEILTGRSPHPALGALEIVAHLHSGQPIPNARELEPRAPPELVAVAARALSIEPDDRYPSAAELAAEVDAWRSGRRVGAYTYSSGELALRLMRRHRAPLAVAGVAAVVLAALLVLSFARIDRARDRAVAADARSQGTLASLLTEQAGVAAEVHARPEAELLAAYALTLREDPDARGVLARFGVASRPELVATEPLPEGCLEPLLSPDGTLLACQEANSLALWTRSPTQLRWRAPDVVGNHAFAGPMLASQRLYRGVVWLDLEDGSPRPYPATMASKVFPSTRAPLLMAVFKGDAVRYAADEEWAPRVESVCVGGTVETLALCHEGPCVAAACADGSLWLDSDGRGTWGGLPLSHRAKTLRFAPDDTRLLAAGFRGALSVLDPAHPERPAVTLRGLRSAVAALSWSPDGARVAAADDIGRVWVWSAETGALLARMPSLGLPATALAFDAPGRHLIVAAEALQTWRLPDRWRPSAMCREGGIAAVALSPDERHLATAHGTGEVAVWRTADGGLDALLQWQGDVAKRVSFSPDGQWLASAGIGDPTARVFETRSWTEVASLGPNHLKQLAWASDGAWLAGAPYGPGNVQFWRSGSWAPTVRVRHPAIIEFVAPVGPRILALDGLGALVHLDLDAGEPTPLRDFGAPGTLAVSADGSVAAFAAFGRDAMVLDPDTGATVLELPTAAHQTMAVAVSPDGSWVSTGGHDQVVRLWPTAGGPAQAVLRGHTERVSALAFSSSGRWLASGAWDGCAQLWDLASVQADPAALLPGLERAWGATAEEVARSGRQVPLR